MKDGAKMTVEQMREELNQKCDQIGKCEKCPLNQEAYYICDFTEEGTTDEEIKRLYSKMFSTHIKDSGERTEFETGAVRDMRNGKGRCDLMPLEVVSEIMDDVVIRNIANFQKTNDYRNLLDALLHFADNHNWSLCDMMLETSIHFEEGAKKYGENNWQKGIPVWCYIDSAVRHYLKYLRSDMDEPHDRAFVWNLLCCIWEIKHDKTNASV